MVKWITKSMSCLALHEIKQFKKKNDDSSILFILNHVQKACLAWKRKQEIIMLELFS